MFDSLKAKCITLWQAAKTRALKIWAHLEEHHDSDEAFAIVGFVVCMVFLIIACVFF